MMRMTIKDFKAYPILRKSFMRYIEGTDPLPAGFSKNRLFFDYLNVRRRNPEKRVSMSEYMIFGFYHLPMYEQKAFLTDVEATRLMRPYNADSVAFLKDKVCFLKTFQKYIHRDWLYLPEAGKEEFRAFVQRHPVIALKPPMSSWGIGFKKLNIEGTEDIDSLFEKLAKQDYLAEEYLVSDERLARFHPASLNTIRVITFRNGDRFDVLGAGLRVGNRGLPVDNAHGGGIFCEVDIRNGIIQTDGLDENGNVFAVHPVTGIRFKGQQLPSWREIIELCREASNTLPCLHVVGWDIAVLPGGIPEMIEGNHNPGMNIVQAPAKRGIKDKFASMLIEYYGEAESYSNIVNKP